MSTDSIIKRLQGTGMNVVNCPICKAVGRDQWNSPVFIPISRTLAAFIRAHGAVTLKGTCTGQNPSGTKHTRTFTIEAPTNPILLDANK